MIFNKNRSSLGKAKREQVDVVKRLEKAEIN